jgi:hypothetical protein
MQSRMQLSDKNVIFLSTILFAVLVASSAILRGGWMDELSSFSFTDPAQSVAALNKSSWAADSHAPTYYFVLRLWRILVAPLSGLIAIRSLSIVAAFALAIAAVYAYGAFVRGRVCFFVVLLLTSPVVIFYAQEARSYVFSVFGGVFLGIMFLACLAKERLKKSRFIMVALTGFLGGLLCSVHIISVLTAAFFLGCLGAIALWQRQWRIVTLAGILIGLTALPGVAVTLLLTTGVQSGLKSIWITRMVVLETFVWLPAFVGLPTLVLAFALLWKRAFALSLFGNPVLRPAFYALGAACIFVAVVSVMATVKPFLTLRYLAAWAGFMIPATALLVESVWQQSNLRLARYATIAIVACFVVDTAAAMISPHHQGDWRTPGNYVKSILECRDATIPIALLTFVPAEKEIKTWSYFFAWYADNADRFVPATEANLDRAATQACPVRLWLGHIRPRYLSNEVLTAVATTCDRGAIDALEFDSGYLFVAHSDRMPQWAGSRTTCPKVMDELRVEQKLRAGKSTAR